MPRDVCHRGWCRLALVTRCGAVTLVHRPGLEHAEQLGGVNGVVAVLPARCGHAARLDGAEDRGAADTNRLGGVTEGERGHVRTGHVTWTELVTHRHTPRLANPKCRPVPSLPCGRV